MLILKELREEYFEEIKTFFKNVFTNEPWNDDWSDDEQLSYYIEDIAGCFNSINYGLFEDDEMIGLSIGNKRHWWSGTEYIINEFCIKTNLQGQGIGTKFLKEIEADIVKKGMKQIFLQTERNVPAYEFYKRNGFIELNDHVTFVKEIFL